MLDGRPPKVYFIVQTSTHCDLLIASPSGISPMLIPFVPWCSFVSYLDSWMLLNRFPECWGQDPLSDYTPWPATSWFAWVLLDLCEVLCFSFFPSYEALYGVTNTLVFVFLGLIYYHFWRQLGVVVKRAQKYLHMILSELHVSAFYHSYWLGFPTYYKQFIASH